MGSPFNFWWGVLINLNNEVFMKRKSFVLFFIIFIGTLMSNDVKIGYIDSAKIFSELQ